MAALVTSGDELELRIESLASAARSRAARRVRRLRAARAAGRSLARVTKARRSHAEAHMIDVIEAGPGRVEAPCDHVPACGGCRLKDLAYDVQLREKEAQVRDALVRLGGIAEPPLEPAVAAESAFRYRNKLEYSFAPGPDGGIVLGFHRAGRWDEVLDVHDCWLTTELGNDIRQTARVRARAEELRAYDQEAHKGFLRHLVVREGRNTGQALVMLVTAPGELLVEPFVRAMTRFPEVRSVYWGINDRPAEVTNVPARLLWGEEAIEEELCGLRFRVRPNAFLQTNTQMAERLYGLAVEYAGLTGAETVYDLYCGTGTIALVMAGDAMTVWGVEASEESVACAIENAELNGIGNAAFFAGECRALAGGYASVRDRRRGRGRSAASRPVEGAAAGGEARGEADRLRLVQPTTLAPTSRISLPSGVHARARGPWTCSPTRRISRRWLFLPDRGLAGVRAVY
jgi:23S rRNA (uracil1939-C5)-methyltransferase